jgi:hypothetical protein
MRQPGACFDAADLPDATPLNTPLHRFDSIASFQRLSVEVAMPTLAVVPPSILQHFAPRRDELQALAERNQRFCDMCEEFAAAEAALARIEGWPEDLRGERLDECQGWIERLIAEMDDALCSAKVMPFPPRPTASRR